MNLEDLKPAPYNPRSMTQHALDGLTFSMGRFGDLSGIVWNKKTGNVVCGHQRLRALREKYGVNLQILDSTESNDEAYIYTPDKTVKFKVRKVDWDLPMEKAANLAGNATHITGNFTLGVNQVIDDVLKDLPDVASSLELDLLKINIDDPVGDDEKQDEEDEKKSITCPNCSHKWVVK